MASVAERQNPAWLAWAMQNGGTALGTNSGQGVGVYPTAAAGPGGGSSGLGGGSLPTGFNQGFGFITNNPAGPGGGAGATPGQPNVADWNQQAAQMFADPGLVSKAAKTSGFDWNSIQGWAADLPGNNVELPQYDPFADDTPHWGWNPGEAGPPGSPDFVRNPKTDADWQQRYYWFMQDEDHKRMLDPRWRPINAWYNAQNPNAHAILGEVARGERDLWGWTPQAAQQQLEGWGVKWQPEASSGGGSGGGGSTWNPGGGQPPSRIPQKQPTEEQLRNAFPGLYPTAVGKASGTLGGVKSPTWTDNAGVAWSGYEQNTPGGGGLSGVDGSLRPMKQVLTPAGPMWVPA